MDGCGAAHKSRRWARARDYGGVTLHMAMRATNSILTELLSIVLQRSLEAIVCLVHVELKFARLFVIELLRCPHLIESDEPLHNLTLALKVLVRHLVDGLDDLDEERMQCVLFHEPDLDGIEEGDEGFGRIDDQRCVSEVTLLAGFQGALFDCNGYANA